MKRIGIPVPRALFFLLFWCFASAFTYPQSLRFDDFARQIDRELKPMKPHQVAVLDFRNTGDSGNLQGHYLAWLVSEALSEASNRSYKVANHKSFDDDLSKHHIIDALGPDPTHPSISPVIRADVLLTGTIAHENNGYLLRITPVFVTTKESLPSLSARIPATEFLDSMLGPLPSDVPELTTKSLWAEMNLPSCVYCPDPSYTDPARQANINGRDVFMVVVSLDGRVAQIRPVKLLGYGLDEQAYVAIKKWTFRPATRKKDGTPVAVAVPIEVTFRRF